MYKAKQTDFDFDEMARLAKDDPSAFEQRRQQMLNEVLEQASPELQRRMQGLQWQVDQVRSNSDNPMAACIRISSMMWDSVLAENGLLENLQRLQNGDLAVASQQKPTAEVINLRDGASKND